MSKVKTGKMEFCGDGKGVFISQQDAWDFLQGLNEWHSDRAFIKAADELKVLFNDVEAAGVEPITLKSLCDCRMEPCPTCRRPK